MSLQRPARHRQDLITKTTIIGSKQKVRFPSCRSVTASSPAQSSQSFRVKPYTSHTSLTPAPNAVPNHVLQPVHPRLAGMKNVARHLGIGRVSLGKTPTAVHAKALHTVAMNSEFSGTVILHCNKLTSP